MNSMDSRNREIIDAVMRLFQRTWTCEMFY